MFRIYSAFWAKIYAEVFFVKKPSKSNSGIKKQLMSGAVYIALAVTVVAVTVSTITATFSENEKKSDSGKKGDTIYNSGYEIKLPDTNIPNVPDEKPVSDVKQGVDAKVTENEQGNDNKAENKDNVSNKETLSGIELAEPDVTEDNSNGETLKPDKSKPSSEEPAEQTFELGYNGYIKPVSGYISKEYSVEVPVYSATMYDYRTHSGVDIACDIGTPVRAVTNGVIKDIYNDYMMGTTVVIEHADGICSVYRNLSPDLPAETVIGRSVLTGETIAGVGNSALCEASEVSHLHFEMTKGENHVDPAEFLN